MRNMCGLAFSLNDAAGCTDLCVFTCRSEVDELQVQDIVLYQPFYSVLPNSIPRCSPVLHGFVSLDFTIPSIVLKVKRRALFITGKANRRQIRAFSCWGTKDVGLSPHRVQNLQSFRWHKHSNFQRLSVVSPSQILVEIFLNFYMILSGSFSVGFMMH